MAGEDAVMTNRTLRIRNGDGLLMYQEFTVAITSSFQANAIFKEYRVPFLSPVRCKTPFSTSACKSLVAVAREVLVILR